MTKYHYHESTDIHVFGKDLDDATKPRTALDTAKYGAVVSSYVSAGGNLTKAGVAARFGLTISEVKLILDLGPQKITKDSPPYLAAQLDNYTVEELQEQYRESHYRQLQKAISDQKAEQANKGYNRRVENEIIMTEIKDAIRESLVSFKIPEVEAVIPECSNTAMVYCYQDWHAGAAHPADQATGEYNADVFKNRIAQCVENLDNMPDADSIYIAFIGDLLDSPLANMHHDQGMRQDVHGMDQIRMAAEAAAQLIAATVERYPGQKIEVLSVSGNHDRLTKDRSIDTKGLGNTLVMEFAKEYLRDVEYVSFHYPDFKWFGFNATDKVRIIMNHGDNNVDPRNLVAEDSPNPALHRIVIQGHNHDRFWKECGTYTCAKMPAVIAGTGFISNSLGKSKRPGQGAIFIEDFDDDRTFSIQPIYIDLL